MVQMTEQGSIKDEINKVCGWVGLEINGQQNISSEQTLTET
jgi:hypothetical protein